MNRDHKIVLVIVIILILVLAYLWWTDYQSYTSLEQHQIKQHVPHKQQNSMHVIKQAGGRATVSAPKSSYVNKPVQKQQHEDKMTVEYMEKHLHDADESTGTFHSEKEQLETEGASRYIDMIAHDQLDARIFDQHNEAIKKSGNLKKSLLHGNAPIEIIPRYEGIPPTNKGGRRPYLSMVDPEDIVRPTNASVIDTDELLTF